MKTCKQCRRELSVDCFWADRRRRDGLQVWCKECRYQWVKDNPEKRRAIKRRAYLKNDGRAQAARARAKNPEPSRAVCRKWYQAHPDKAAAIMRRNALRRRYGLTPAQYDAMHNAQSGRCAICGGNRNPQGKRLAVDHCHKTNEIRGLLCTHCNAGLGYFDDSPVLLMAAIQYLAKRAREVA